MRLTDNQQQAIREEASRVFGPDAVVRLFGSRVDDAARGGDIDLHIQSAGTATELFDRELKLHARLMRRLGERRVDLVVQNPNGSPRPIDQQATWTGVVL